jgi:prophage DNA circulation protein
MSGSIYPRLRAASYRGAVFYVEEAGGDYGRRFADHEYPGRDTPYAEPLGRRQRVWPITGYTLGPFFRAARDDLLAACENDGIGELIHPTLGIVDAVCRRITFSEQREARGRCVFAMEFAEPGELEEPASDLNTDMQIEGAADALGTASSAAFIDSFNVVGTLSYVATGAATDVQMLAATLGNLRMPASGYPQAPAAEAIGVLYDQAGGLVYQPPQLCSATEAAFAAFSNAGEPYAVGMGMLELAMGYTAGAQAVDVRLRVAQYPARTRNTMNQAAWQSYCRQQALREIGYCIPGVPIESRAEGLELLARVSAAFDAAETAAADVGADAVFIALIRLRSAIVSNIEARNATNLPAVIYQTQNTSNSLVLAWKFYRDAGRDLELVEAVQAINPAFMPRSGYVRAV